MERGPLSAGRLQEEAWQVAQLLRAALESASLEAGLLEAETLQEGPQHIP